MPNQFTKYAGYIPWAEGPLKFTVILTVEQSEQLNQTANKVRLSKSDLMRWLIDFVAKRVAEIDRLYPDLRAVPIETVMSKLYDSKRLAQQEANARAYRWQMEYEEAMRIDGLKVDYAKNSEVRQFHELAWSNGVAVEELIEQMRVAIIAKRNEGAPVAASEDGQAAGNIHEGGEV